METISLSRGEVDLLNLLISKGGRARPDEVPLEKSTAMSIAELLREKGVVKVTREVRTFLEPTARGLKCVKRGLPEERLVEVLRAAQGRLRVKELASSKSFEDVTELNAAIGEAKRRGWVRTDKVGEFVLIELIEESPKSELGKSLRRIATAHPEEQEVSRDLASQLKRRNLIKEHRHVDLLLELDEIGKGIAEGRIVILHEVSALTRELLESGRWREAKLKSYDVTASPPRAYPGRLHPYAEFLDEVREILIGMGFEEVKGPYVESEFWNFDSLFQPQDHPAREIHSSYILSYPVQANIEDLELVERVKRVHEDGGDTGSTGWGYEWSFDLARSLILMTQTTAWSMRTIAKHRELPMKIFAIDPVFRPEVLDKIHSMEFHQCEGVVMAEDLNTRHILGFLVSLAKGLGFREDEIAFKPGYFPFTEPSVEAQVWHERLGWVEALGAGMFRPEVLAPHGVDARRVGALAWGIGIGRLAMARLGIEDIRDLHSRDLAFLREFHGGG